MLIDDNCTLVQAHEFTEELEDHIRAVLPAITVNIHIEPYHAEMRHQKEAHGVTLEPLAASLPPDPEAAAMPNLPDPSASHSIPRES